jgi:hypothetical protein
MFYDSPEIDTGDFCMSGRNSLTENVMDKFSCCLGETGLPGKSTLYKVEGNPAAGFWTPEYFLALSFFTTLPFGINKGLDSAKLR